MTRFFKWTPNGIDRVDFATANYFIDPSTARGLAYLTRSASRNA